MTFIAAEHNKILTSLAKYYTSVHSHCLNLRTRHRYFKSTPYSSSLAAKSHIHTKKLEPSINNLSSLKNVFFGTVTLSLFMFILESSLLVSAWLAQVQALHRSRVSA